MAEIIVALRSGIRTDIDFHKDIFGWKGYRRTLEILRTMKRTGSFRPSIIASSEKSLIFEQVSKDLTILPFNCMDAIVSFYESNQAFTASYNCLGTEQLVRGGYDAMRTAVRETHKDAKKTLENGQAAIQAINEHLNLIETRNAMVWAGNIGKTKSPGADGSGSRSDLKAGTASCCCA